MVNKCFLVSIFIDPLALEFLVASVARNVMGSVNFFCTQLTITTT